MIVDVAKVVELALSHVGRGEVTGRNDGPYVEAVVGERVPAGTVGPAWCAAWIMFIHDLAGYRIARRGPIGSPRLLPFWPCRNVARMHEELRARGCIVGAGDDVRPGDVCIQLGAVEHAAASGHMDLVAERLLTPGAPKVVVVGGNVGNVVARRVRDLWHPTTTAYARPSRILEAA